jgi:DNA-binding response OmpR family regulator
MSDAGSGKKKILVVEDEVVICTICRVVLEAKGFDVYTAADCLTAQKLINHIDYDLCLIDIFIPEMSGRQLYQWLLETHPKLTTRVIFCTGSAMDGRTKHFLEKSGRPLLPKPFSIDELISIIQEAMR